MLSRGHLPLHCPWTLASAGNPIPPRLKERRPLQNLPFGFPSKSGRCVSLLVEQILPVAPFSLLSSYPSFSIFFELLGTTTHHLCPKHPTPLASTSLFKLPNLFALQIFTRCQYPGIVTKCSGVSGSILSTFTSISSMNPHNPMRQGLYWMRNVRLDR